MENPVIINFDNGTLMQVSQFSRITRTRYGTGLIIHNPGDTYTITFKTHADREKAIETIIDKLKADIIDIKNTQPDV